MREESVKAEAHILLFTARSYDRAVAPDLAPVGCRYDEFHGMWRLADGSGAFWADKPDRRPPRTKKHDVETGEDQKGA